MDATSTQKRVIHWLFGKNKENTSRLIDITRSRSMDGLRVVSGNCGKVCVCVCVCVYVCVSVAKQFKLECEKTPESIDHSRNLRPLRRVK